MPVRSGVFVIRAHIKNDDDESNISCQCDLWGDRLCMTYTNILSFTTNTTTTTKTTTTTIMFIYYKPMLGAYRHGKKYTCTRTVGFNKRAIRLFFFSLSPLVLSFSLSKANALVLLLLLLSSFKIAIFFFFFIIIVVVFSLFCSEFFFSKTH